MGFYVRFIGLFNLPGYIGLFYVWLSFIWNYPHGGAFLGDGWGFYVSFFFSPFRFSSYSFSLFLGWVMTLCVYVVWYVSFFLASLFCSFLSFYYLSSYTFLECPHFNDMMSCTWMARMGYVVFSCLMVTLQLWEASSFTRWR